MTKEDCIEKTKEQIKVMQAFVDGNPIECGRHVKAFHGSIISGDEPGIEIDWNKTTSPDWDWRSLDYRIKPEPTYYPYTSPQLSADIKKHGQLVCKKEDRNYGFAFVGLGPTGVTIVTKGFVPYKDLFENWMWFDDGSPCGTTDPLPF